MNTNCRIEILGIDGKPLKGEDVKELKEVFKFGNVIKYSVVRSDNDLRVVTGTPQLNFIFNVEKRTIEEEVEFMKKRVMELQKIGWNWFDKRTTEYKLAKAFANGFNTPLIFEEAI